MSSKTHGTNMGVRHEAVFLAGIKEADKEWMARTHPFMYTSPSFLPGDGAQLGTIPMSSFRQIFSTTIILCSKPLVK